MHAYNKMAQKMGAHPDQVLEMMPGGVVSFSKGKAKVEKSILYMKCSSMDWKSGCRQCCFA